MIESAATFSLKGSTFTATFSQAEFLVSDGARSPELFMSVTGLVGMAVIGGLWVAAGPVVRPTKTSESGLPRQAAGQVRAR
jgi:hypothetical protein